MRPDEKLARIARAIREAGIDALVMGGHAVRYYGVDRNTTDFDMVAAVDSPSELRAQLPDIPILGLLKEIPAWRSNDFARFEIGTLPDGRQEVLEFWIHNHLLPEFPELKARAEVGRYGGDDVIFVSLDDLIRSKETERESDWQDISLLEEIRDARLLAQATDPEGKIQALQNVRSRRGFDRLVSSGLLTDAAIVRQAIGKCTHPVTFAMWLPLAPAAKLDNPTSNIEPTTLAALAKVPFRSALHLGMIEVVRRGYKREAMEKDRQDKQAKLKSRRENRNDGLCSF